MAHSTQLLGLVDIIWRNTRIPVEKGAKLKIGGMQNTAVPYGTQVGRYEGFAESTITATTFLRRGMRFGDLFQTTEGPLQVICDTGQIFSWDNAFLTERPEITSGEGGKIELKWAAGTPEETLTNA